MNTIQDFLTCNKNVDVGAITRICEMVTDFFTSETLQSSIEYQVEDEPEGKVLFVRVDTNGMDFDEQLKREIEVRSRIAGDVRLDTAKRRHVVLTVF